ncbi:hypothetical protein GCM10007391_18910 [Alteromonas halophila]|uniref:Capsular biosynthesis protein n=1 Tax=Alteromonas halophila TaxID=516698 RepID=A0A918MYI5_9ALTE|nr:hypothetical protein GCM10007391_18910 [Alteromonas halophila]
MADKQQPSFLLMARGGSHIRYFNYFRRHTDLQVDVVSVTRAMIRPAFFRFWRDVKTLDLDHDVQMHLAKKRKKLPFLTRQPFAALSACWVRFIMRLQIVKYCGLIHARDCDVVGVWNGQKMPSVGIAKAAWLLEKSVVYFENGLLPDTTTCDWQGVNCRNSLPKDPEFYRQFDRQDKQLPTDLLPRAAKTSKARGINETELPKRYIFVPFQVETDSQIICNSAWIKSMAQLHAYLCNALDALDDPDLHIVIKEHPSESIRHDHLHGRHPRVLFANQCATQQLIEKAQAVMTINSTVGIESLLLNKPVMVLGEACYGVPGVTLGITNEQELKDALSNPTDTATDSELKRGFLNFLHQHYVIPKAAQNVNETHVNALTRRLLKQDALSAFLAETDTSAS